MIVLRLASVQRGNHCPTCGTWSERVHSQRYRTVQDIPLFGKTVFLRVRSRKFFCDCSSCSTRI
ncbi:transposase family protein, partial [Alicyclobacillus fructus]